MKHSTFATTACRIVIAIALSVVFAGAASAQDSQPAAEQAKGVCVALVLPSVQGVEGSATEMATGVRELFSSYLTGPSIRSIVLDARLASQAAEEARLKGCANLLMTTLTFKRRGGGSGVARALGRAASAAAWHAPYAGTAAGAAARSAAISGAEAAASIAETTREKDEVTLDVRLIVANGRTVTKSDKGKAKRSGEDLITPLVQRASEAVLAAITAK